MKGRFARHPIASLKRHAIRLRQRSKEELEALARSWLKQPVHPIVCRPDLTVADGHGRLDGLELLGETEVDVFITDQDLTDDELTELGFVTAYHRAPLDDYEQAHAVKKIHDARPGLTLKALAEALGLDPSEPTRLLSLFDCEPEVQQAARDGRIGKTDWYAIKRSPDQLAALVMKLNGSTRDDIERESRRQKNAGGEATPAVRLPKLKIEVASEAATGTVNVAGEALDLEAAETLLKEAIKLVRAARDKNLDPKTAQAVWKDMAKAG